LSVIFLQQKITGDKLMPFVAQLPVDKEVVFETFPATTLEDGKSYAGLNIQVEDLRRENAALKEQVVDLTDRIKLNEEEYDELIKNTATKQEGLDSQINNLTRERKKLLTRLEKLTEEVNKSETKLNNLFDENLGLREEADKKSSKIDILERSEINLQESIDQYAEQLVEFQSDLAELRLTNGKLQKDFSQETRKSQVLATKLKESEEKSAKTLAAKQVQMQRLKKTLNDNKEELASKQAEIKELEKEIERLKAIVTIDSLFDELQLELPDQNSFQVGQELKQLLAIKTTELASVENELAEITYVLPGKIGDIEAENNKIVQIKERLKKLNTPAMGRVEMRALLEDIKVLAETNSAAAANFLTDEYKGKHIGLYIAELMKENPKATEPLAKFYISIMYKLIDSKHIEKFSALAILCDKFSMQLAKNCMKIPNLLEFFSRSLVLMADEKNPSVSKIIFNTISAMLDKKKSQNNGRNFYNTLKHSIPCDISSAPEQIFNSLINFINLAPMSPKRELAKRFQESCKKKKITINKIKLEGLEIGTEREKILTEIKSCLAADCFKDQEEILHLEKDSLNTEESKPKKPGLISFFRLSKSYDICQSPADINEHLQKDFMGSHRPMTL
jgi:uncharacterized protein YoxC